ncbi:MAG: radical SAM protein [Candidatus Cloacimonetes bacterium]|nr:radical SAM protein [Candidatus Cloacimonadota bacterium]
MGTDKVVSLISELAVLGVRTFAVTGGEPLLREDLALVLHHARSVGINTGIATNGFLLDGSMALALAQAGVSSVQISIDGDRDPHNRIRHNELSYDRAVSAARNCREAGIALITVATVVTKSNIETLPTLLNTLLSEGIRYWKLIPLMPIGRADKSELQIEPATLIAFLEFVRQARRRIRIQIGENLPYLGKYDSQTRNLVTYCPVGITACCLGVDGKIRGCPEMPDSAEFYEGSVLETNFDTIWQRGFVRYREDHLRHQDHDCAKCSWWNRCRGGCWVMRTGEWHCIKNWLIY